MVQAQALNVTLRDTRGREADAACGQLRLSIMGSGAATPLENEDHDA